MRYIIGTDIGTTHTKAIAYSSDGLVLTSTQKGYEPVTESDGTHELRPDEVFNAVMEVWQQLTAKLHKEGITDDPVALAFSSAMHSLIAVDEAGIALTNCITWADLRSSAQAERLHAAGMAPDLYTHTGTPVHPMSPLCKLIWMRETKPSLHQEASKFVGIREYILFRLTGQWLVDESIASATGLFDIHVRDWYQPALALAGIDEKHLSHIVSTTFIIQGIAKEYAAKTGIAAGTPVIAGASDGCLANVGSNALQPGDLNITIGTSGAVRMITNLPQTDEYGRVFNYILDETHYVCGGPINNGGALIEWYAAHFLQRDIRNRTAMEWFMQQAASVPAGAEGLLMLPYVRGERAPVWDAGARGAFVGLDQRHTQAHMMRAVVEGINYAVYDVLLAVRQTLHSEERIFISGGITQSAQPVQWLADLVGAGLHTTNTADASAIGAAILGWVATGELSSLKEAAMFFPQTSTYKPDFENHTILQQYFIVYRELYNNLRNSFRQLNKLRDQ